MSRPETPSESVYDVIIVGAGPGGATAAYVLGRAGVKTLLIDKGRFPRDKACGGGISARVLTRFPYLRNRLDSIPVHPVSKIHIESPGGRTVTYAADAPLYLMIRRLEFDNLLFEMAREKVQVLEDTLVTGIRLTADSAIVRTKEGRRLESRLLIGADGANSIVARAAGLMTADKKKTFAIDMMEETEYSRLDIHDRDTMYVYYVVKGNYGYAYVFPKKSHVNLGVGYKLDHYLKEGRKSPYESYLDIFAFLRKCDVVSGESESRNFLAFPIPVSGPLARTYRERTMLCGDAGGFVNAFTAEGIYFAMVSGEHAATAAIQALARSDFSENQLSQFEVLWKREIGFDLAKSVDIQKILFADSTRIDRIVKAASRDRRLAGLLAGYATGSIDYRTFRRSVIARALPLYVREKVRSAFSGRR